jgi:predicted transcriptional regulator
MLPEIGEIAHRRRKLGLSQSALAKSAGVSQSMVAKIEKGRISPGYASVKRIFEALYSKAESNGPFASDIMCKSVVSIAASDKVSTAIGLLRSKGISQLPVMHGEHAIGSVSEQTMLEKLDSGIPREKLAQMQVSQIMDAPFPSLPPNAPIGAVSELLRYSQAILVLDRRKLAGVITKADVLKAVSRL